MSRADTWVCPYRIVGRFFLPLMLLLVLAGCASGTARDAERAEEQEATRGVVLPEQQATSVAERLFDTTPSPEATKTPIPVLESLVLARGLGSGDAPQNEIQNAPSVGTVYAAALIHDLTEGQTVTAVWATSSGSEVSREETTIESSTGERWVSFRLDLNGSLPSGDYAVYYYVDGVLLNSLVFRIS